MITKVEDLRKGDEILFPSNRNFIYYKVLADPKPHPKYAGRWKTIRCSCKRKKVETWRKGHYKSVRVFTTDVKEHNSIDYVNFNWKQPWLVKRENND